MATDVPVSKIGEPAWEIATLFPNQGDWTEHEYLRLDSVRLVEFCEGRLEVLPLPTELHQLIAFYLCLRLCEYAELKAGGLAVIAPLRVRIHGGRFREPDVAFMLAENRDRRSERFWNGADLVMEVVGADDPDRDWVTKRAEYAQSRIAEYWIADPRDRSITIFTLDLGSTEYRQAGRYTGGQTAVSGLLPGFAVDVDETFQQSR